MEFHWNRVKFLLLNPMEFPLESSRNSSGIILFQWKKCLYSTGIPVEFHQNSSGIPHDVNAINISFSFFYSPHLIRMVAEAISVEVRARNNDFVKRKIFSSHTGLNCFSPVINIMRHPLWGRNQVITILI